MVVPPIFSVVREADVHVQIFGPVLQVLRCGLATPATREQSPMRSTRCTITYKSL